MGLRRKGREIILQTLYSLDYNQASNLIEQSTAGKPSYEGILSSLLETNSIKEESRIRDFSKELIETIINNLIAIDDIIKMHLEHWTIEQLAVLDRNLLRMAVAEIVFRNTPPAIVINEVLEIAKKFSGEQSGRLLNGVLDQIVKNIERSRTKNDE